MHIESIKTSMSSEKTILPDYTSNVSVYQERSVFHLMDTTDQGVRMRHVINMMLRNPKCGPLKSFSLRKSAAVGYDFSSSTTLVPRAELVRYSKDITRQTNGVIAQINIFEQGLSAAHETLRLDPNNFLAKQAVAENESNRLYHKKQLSLLKFKVNVCNQALAYQGLVKASTYAKAVGNEGVLVSSSSSEAVLPIYRKPVTGVQIQLFTDCKELEKEVAEYLLNQVIHRCQHGQDLTILAPPQALSEDGKVQPLPEQFQEALIAYTLRKTTIRPPEEALAWQWLIVSHNQTCGKGNKVPLHNALRKGWNDPLNKRLKQRKQSHLDQITALKDEIATLRASLASSVNNLAEETKVECPPSPVYEQLTDNSLNGKLTTSEYLVAPRTMIYHGRECEQVVDLDFMGKLVGKSYRLFTVQVNPGEYATYIDTPDTDVDISVDYEACQIFDKPKSPVSKSDKSVLKVAKAKTIPLKTKEKDEGKTPVANNKGKTPSPKRKTEKSASSGAASAGPLRVKDVPRSSVLNEEQKKALKKKFQIDETPIEKSAWDALNKREKSALRKARSIPRWAIQSVSSNPLNLDKILKGQLTIENFNSSQEDRKSSSKEKKTPPSVKSNRGRQRSKSPLVSKRDRTPRRSYPDMDIANTIREIRYLYEGVRDRKR